MGQRCIIIIIFVFLAYITGSFSDPVKVTVEGFVGDSVVLSCSISESEVQDKIEEFSTHWRDDEGKKVCDITGGKRLLEVQDSKYKDRVETFPEEYKKGNFSIKLNDLQQTDTRKYICHITGPSQNHTVTELQVQDRQGGSGNHGGLNERTEKITIQMTSHDTFQKEVITELHVKDKPKGKGNHGEPSLIVLLFSFIFTIVLPFI